ncbi:12786_t:CDS:2, partial [Funneliformis caledonium]
AVLAIILMSRIIDRNHDVANEFNHYYNNGGKDDCSKLVGDRIRNIIGENIYNQNTIQIITIAVINYLCALVEIVQIVEINRWKKQADECLNADKLDGDKHSIEVNVETYEVPLIIILLICATLQVFFTWQLYRQFGWNIYKKIGADLRMQRLYRTMLIFVMFLKIDLFFMSYLAIEACTVSPPNRLTDSRLFYFHVCITIIIVLSQILAYRSLRSESSLGMKIFIGAWIVCIADFIILLKFSIKSSSEESWYFFSAVIVIGLVMGLVTLLWSIFVLRNFGKGLKPHLSRPYSLPTQRPSNNITSSSDPPTRPPRWAIDD